MGIFTIYGTDMRFRTIQVWGISLLTVGLLSVMSGCGRSGRGEDPVVARIGEEVITASEFRSNYEFGMPFLKKGPDPKAAYLDYMIREKILAAEGYRLGFDRNAEVLENEKELVPELLMEELFEHEIKAKITVSPEEVREAITKSKVRWKFRYWFEPNLADARRIQAAMREAGYARVVAELLDSNPELKLKPENFETGYVTWMDIDPDILEAIKDLPAGEISDPILINGTWVIFQITDIQRESFTENAYLEAAESMRQTLFYRKAQAAVRRYVDQLMTPLNVRTKGEAFRMLADAVAEWRQQPQKGGGDFLAAVKAAGPDNGQLFRLQQNLDQTLTLFEGGRWSVADFLERYDPAALKSDPQDLQALRSELNQRLAITLRDEFLGAEARRLKLHRSARLQRTLGQWRDKWVYDQSRRHFLRDLKLDSTAVRHWFEQNSRRYQLYKDKKPEWNDFREEARRDAWIDAARVALSREATELQSRYRVTINKAVLDTISVTTSEASKWMSVQLFKSGSERMAVPIADPAWGL